MSAQNGNDSPLRETLLSGDLTHNVIILSGRLGRVPVSVLLVLCLLGAVAVGRLYSAPWIVGAVLAAAVLTDAGLLWLLPRLGISFGPVQGPLTLFTGGRFLLALPLALLPAGWDLAVLAALQGLLSACSLWGHLVEPFRVRVNRVRAPILKPLRGQRRGRPLRLVLLTDLHVERLTRREQRVLELVEELDPDLVLFGGDLLNLSYVEDPLARAHARDFFETLGRRHALRVVLGNPTVEVRQVVLPFWESLGITPLDAQSEPFDLEGARFRLYGLPATRSLEADSQRLAELLATHPPSPDEATVLLYHLPDLAGLTPGIHLYLAGHTHGGQIRLPLLPPFFTASGVARRLARGTHRLDNTLLHTSRGLGMEGAGAPRMRFFCPPEVTLVELTVSAGGLHDVAAEVT